MCQTKLLFLFPVETETMSGTKKYYEVFEKELHTEKALTGWSNT